MARKGHINKFVAWLITIATLITLLPAFTAFADVSTSDFIIASTDETTLTEGTDYSFDGKKLTVSTQTPVKISMADDAAPTSNVIAVDTSKGNVSISFSNINIKTTEREAIRLSGNNSAELNFSGTNTLSAKNAGIETNTTALKIKSGDNGRLKITDAAFAIDSSITISGKPLNIEGNIHLEINNCTSHAIYYQTGPVSFSGSPVVDIEATTSKYAIYGIGLTFSGGTLSINCTVDSGSSYAICSGGNSNDVEISGTTDIHIKKARRGITTNGGDMTVTDSAKIRMYDGEDGNRTGGITMGNIITTQTRIKEGEEYKTISGELLIGGNAVIDALTAGDGISSGDTKITDDAKVYITVDSESKYSVNGLRIIGNTGASGTLLEILKNAVFELNVKNGAKIYGIYGDSKTAVHISDSARVKLSGTLQTVYAGVLNLSGNASMIITDTREKALANGTLTIADSATFEASLITTSEPGKTDKVMGKYTVKPAIGKAYKIKAGNTPDTATEKYYASETTETAVNTWRYFSAEPADVSPVTITATDKTITYDGNIYDVSQMFKIDPNAGAATYSVVNETGTDAGAGTLSGKELTITKAGKIKIKVNTAQKGIFLPGEATAILTVDKGTPPEITFPTASEITYGEILKDSKLTGGSTNGTFSWLFPNNTPTVSNTVGYTAKFKPNDSDVYDYTNVELSKKIMVTVKPRPIIIDWILPQSLVYDGTVKTVTPSVSNKVGDDIINLTVDGTLTAKDKGTYTVRVTAVDDENYTITGGTNLEKEYTITAKTLNADNVSAIADATYTKEEIKPVIGVKDGDKVLLLDTDYNVTYEDNIKAGTAKVNVEFIGNYQGTAQKEFTILPKTINPNIALQEPVKNETPQTAIDTDEYSAVIVWSPEVINSFAYSTVYTAKVTITPKANYTLNGILENGYVFENSESVVNAANSGEVTIIYPSTGSRGGGGGTARYTIVFDTNGGSTIPNRSVRKNSVIEVPSTPTKEGFEFAGWYTDKELKNKYDFSAKVTGRLTLYAAWTEKSTDNSKNQIILTIGKKEASVFGIIKTNDVAPKIVNDRTMLPARFVAENLGAAVDWNDDKQLVTITAKNVKSGENVTILITIGAEKAIVNGKAVRLDSPAFIENDRTYTPIRFISEELGASVEWFEGEQKVVITK